MARQSEAGPPGALQNVSVTADNGGVSLRWSAPADDGGSTILRYEVRSAEGASVPEGIRASLSTNRHFVMPGHARTRSGYPGIHVFLQGYGRVSKRSSQSGFCLWMSLTFQARGQCFKVRSR